LAAVARATASEVNSAVVRSKYTSVEQESGSCCYFSEANVVSYNRLVEVWQHPVQGSSAAGGSCDDH
jgi:hypothetical protein